MTVVVAVVAQEEGRMGWVLEQPAQSWPAVKVVKEKEIEFVYLPEQVQAEERQQVTQTSAIDSSVLGQLAEAINVRAAT